MTRMATPDTTPGGPVVSFTRMADGTREDYELLEGLEDEFAAGTADRVLAHLRELSGSMGGYQVDRLEHSLQSATRAHRDGAEEEMVVAALLHDIDDLLAPHSHGELAALLLRPLRDRAHALDRPAPRPVPARLLRPPCGRRPQRARQVPRPLLVSGRRGLLPPLGSVLVRSRLRFAAAGVLRAHGPPRVRARTVQPRAEEAVLTTHPRSVGLHLIGAAAVAAVLVSALSACVPDGDGGMAARVDAVFADYASADGPGCSVGVIRNGRLVHAAGYGSANLEYGVPNGPATIYRIASVSKQFTAGAIALLALRGEVDLDAPVQRYIPEFPDYPDPPTVRHLVHHTSGVRDYLVLFSLAGNRSEDFITNRDILDAINRQRELNFPPGSEYLYSNSGYVLLGEIVARVTGAEPAGVRQGRVLRPPGHAAHALPRRPQRGRPQPGDRLFADR